MYTSHGHQIPGTPIESPAPSTVARCGAFLGCFRCVSDGMAALRDAASLKNNTNPAVQQTQIQEPSLEVQVRNEEGALLYFRSIKAAMDFAKDNSSVWKISWTDTITHERIRLVLKTVLELPSNRTPGNPVYKHAWVFSPIMSD